MAQSRKDSRGYALRSGECQRADGRYSYPDSRDLWEKEDALKPDYWMDVRETYLIKKNRYLSWKQIDEHPSFNCYIEAVNEVYEKVRRGVLYR